MNAYLDNIVVSSIVRDDNASQSKALNTLLVAHDEGRVSLVTSELTLDEIKKCPPEHRTPLERTFRLLEKVPVAQSHALLYINSHGTARTWINSPVFQNDPLLDALLALGIERVDAEHIYAAAKQGCNAFLTCDNSPRTGILRRAAKIAELCGLAVLRPSELVSAQGW